METVRIERDGAVAILTVDRPEKRNALNAAVRRELIAALDELRDDAGSAWW
jgi:enoyl-CoA hydratase/carnithine racemase